MMSYMIKINTHAQTNLKKKLWVRYRNVSGSVFNQGPNTFFSVPILLTWRYALIDQGTTNCIQQETLKKRWKDNIDKLSEKHKTKNYGY